MAIPQLLAEETRAEIAAAIQTVCRFGGQALTLRSIDLRGVNLSGVRLHSSQFDSACLTGADLSGAELPFARFTVADLSDVNLAGANLRFVECTDTWLKRSNLSGADLSGSRLLRVNLTGANLEGADLTGVELDGTICDIETKWPDNFTGGRSTITKMFPNAQLDACKQAGSRLDAVKMMARVATIPDLETLDWVAETIRLEIFGDTSVRDDMSGEVLLGILEDSDV